MGTLGEEDAHLAADLADLCLSIEGALWIVVGTVVDGNVVLTIRHQGPGGGADDLARRLADGRGRGGGHASMARVEIPVASMPEIENAADDAATTDALLRFVKESLDESRA
jgi:hypothetical protein